jgi:hypothetical protein
LRFFGGEEDTCGSMLAAGVGAGGGKLGSNARAGRPTAVDQPCESRVSLDEGDEARATRAGGGSQPEERNDMAAKVHMIGRRRETAVRGVFE